MIWPDMCMISDLPSPGSVGRLAGTPSRGSVRVAFYDRIHLPRQIHAGFVGMTFDALFMALHGQVNCRGLCRGVSGRVVSGRVGSCRVVSGRVVSCRVGSGRVGSGRVGSGRVGSGRVGSSRVRTGEFANLHTSDKWGDISPPDDIALSGHIWMVRLIYRVGAVRSVWFARSSTRFLGWICTPYIQILHNISSRQIQDRSKIDLLYMICVIYMIYLVICPRCECSNLLPHI